MRDHLLQGYQHPASTLAHHLPTHIHNPEIIMFGQIIHCECLLLNWVQENQPSSHPQVLLSNVQ